MNTKQVEQTTYETIKATTRGQNQTLKCELCGKTFRGQDAHPRGTNVCRPCLTGQNIRVQQ